MHKKYIFSVGFIQAMLVVLSLLLTELSFANEDKDKDAKYVLNVAGWDVYADPVNKNKTIGYKSFEDKFNVIIHFTPLSNLDSILEMAESDNQQDVYLISNEGIRLMHDMQLVVPLKLDKLPHYQNLHHNLQYSEWSLFDGRVYAVPWAWGPTGLLYDVNAIEEEPKSWGVLWQPEYEGKVSLWDDVSMIWTTALYLGYKNVYSLTRNQLDQVEKKLIELNKNIYDYYDGEVEEFDFVLNKKVIALNSWFDPSSRFQKKGHNFKMIIPQEGAVGMFDSYLISKQNHLEEVAYNFINHQISPEIQQKMVRITGLAPANIEALGLLSAEEIKGLHLDEPDYFNRMLLWDHMPRKHLYEKVLSNVRNDLKKRFNK